MANGKTKAKTKGCIMLFIWEIMWSAIWLSNNLYLEFGPTNQYIQIPFHNSRFFKLQIIFVLLILRGKWAFESEKLDKII